MNQRIKKIDELRQWLQTDAWVTWWGAITIAFIVAPLAAAVVAVICGIGLWSMLSAAVAFFATLLAWRAYMEVYLRTGGTLKVGLAYEGWNVPMNEWRRARQFMSSFADDHAMEHRICLRLLPPRAARSEASVARTIDRYGLMVILKAEESQQIEGSSVARSYTFVPFGADRLAEHFREFFGRYADQVDQAFAGDRHIAVLDEIRGRARSRFVRLLIYLAIARFVANAFGEAENACAGAIAELRKRTPENEELVRPLIGFAVQCALQSSAYSNQNIPSETDLRKAQEDCERAIRQYPEESHLIRNCKARNHFWLHEFPLAYDIVIEQMEDMQRAKRKSRYDFAHAMINLFILSLLMGKFKQARDTLARLLNDTQLLEAIEWKTLIEFADRVRFSGNENAVYAQVIYRTLGGWPVSPVLRSDLKKWIGTDRYRLALATELRRIERGEVKFAKYVPRPIVNVPVTVAGERARLVKLAKAQRWLIVLLVAYVAAWAGVGLVGQESEAFTPLEIVLLITWILMLAAVVSVTRRVGGWGWAILVLFLMLIPLVNMLTLLAVNQRAAKRLKRAGFTVGFMGVPRDQLA